VRPNKDFRPANALFSNVAITAAAVGHQLIVIIVPGTYFPGGIFKTTAYPSAIFWNSISKGVEFDAPVQLDGRHPARGGGFQNNMPPRMRCASL
jgi:hypothetical protein